MNILNFIPAVLKHVAGTSGGEYAGACPWCGGEDRFRVWPDHPSGAAGGRFMCRQCGQQGDGIAFLRGVAGLTYQEACHALQVAPGPMKRTAPSARSAWTPKPALMPCEAWRGQAALFIAECCECMAGSVEGMAYAASRGLTADTVRALGIGWNPTDTWQDREAWGLPEQRNKQGNISRMFLPAGLVIPTRRKAGIVAVKVRRTNWTDADTMPKYVCLSGSVPGLALGAGGKPVVIVESELDTVLVHQEAGDLVDVLALGTASGKPDAETAAYLRSAPRILIALDNDDAGRAAATWWPMHFAQAEFWPVMQGKDVGDLAGVPGLVRAWIEAALPDDPQPLPGQIACRGCGKMFTPSDENKKYCSAWCFNHVSAVAA